MDELTDRQKEILRYIARTTEERGFPPTIREIGGEFEIKSTNGVNDHLKALERKGYLSRGEQKSRSLVPTATGRMLLGLGAHKTRAIEIPVVGRVAAGAPLLAEENLDDSVQIDPSVLPQSGKDVFALKVKGDSMIGDGIFDGDLVFVRRQPSARNGEIVVALIENEATVKRFFPEGGGRIRLQPSNPTMEPIYVTAAQAKEASILGIVVGVFRKVMPRA
ncbi:MAG TPA: transcriptional repressor LexA [Myxococcales bacterium]